MEPQNAQHAPLWSDSTSSQLRLLSQARTQRSHRSTVLHAVLLPQPHRSSLHLPSSFLAKLCISEECQASQGHPDADAHHSAGFSTRQCFSHTPAASRPNSARGVKTPTDDKLTLPPLHTSARCIHYPIAVSNTLLSDRGALSFFSAFLYSVNS